MVLDIAFPVALISCLAPVTVPLTVWHAANRAMLSREIGRAHV